MNAQTITHKDIEMGMKRARQVRSQEAWSMVQIVSNFAAKLFNRGTAPTSGSGLAHSA